MARRNGNQELEELREELASLGRRLEKVMAAKGHDLKDSFDDRLEGVAESLRQGWDDTTEFASKKTKQVRDYAEENPWHTAAVAAGLGLVIGMILNSKRNRE